MRKVAVHAAKIHPSRLIEATLAGEDVVISEAACRWCGWSGGRSGSDCSPGRWTADRTSCDRWMPTRWPCANAALVGRHTARYAQPGLEPDRRRKTVTTRR